MKKIVFKLGMVCLIMLGTVSVSSTLPMHTTAATQIKINKKNFPDEKFRWYVKRFDKNKNGSLSKREIKAAKKIEVYDDLYAGWEWTSVLNVKGMEYFTNVRELGIHDYHLKNFDVSKMKRLKKLSLADSYLKVLDLRKNKNLTTLRLFKNNITKIKFASSSNLKLLDINYEKKLQKPDFASLKKLEDLSGRDMPYKSLDLSKCKNLKEFDLRYLGVVQGREDNGALQKISFGKSNKKLKTIVLTGGRIESADWLCKLPDLEVLGLNYNNLTALDVTKNRKLKELYCSVNRIKKLDISRLTNLETLYCSNNNLAALDVTKNSKLERLGSSENSIKNLDISQLTDLEALYCSNNNLTALDVTKNNKLQYLDCSKNHLNGLDLSKNSSLQELNCSKNPLTNLDISQLTNLVLLDCSNCQLTTLDTSSNKKLTTLNSEGNPFK